MPVTKNAGSCEEVEKDTHRDPVVTTIDPPEQQLVTRNIGLPRPYDWKRDPRKGFTFLTPIRRTLDPPEHQSVAENIGGPGEMERDIRRGPVVPTMDLPEQQSVTRNTGHTEDVERDTGRSSVVETADMTRQQLQHEIEKEDRQYYQAECDKMYQYWNDMQEQLRIKDAELQMKDKMLEETHSAFSSEIASYKKRLKNVMLEYDNYKNSHPEKYTGTAEIMKVDDDQFCSQVNILQREKCELTSRMNQMKAEHEEFVTLLILEHKKNQGTMKQQYEETIEMLKNKHDEVLGTLKDMEESKKKEIPKIEETENGLIENLAKYHDQACTDLQNQFGDINGNNWFTIATLKDENKEFQRRERILQIKFDALSRENEFLKGINSYCNEVIIQKNIESINRFGVNHSSQNEVSKLSEEVKRLHQENDLLAERLKITEYERDAFHHNFESVRQYVEERMKTKAINGEQKRETKQENLGMQAALWDPSSLCPSALYQPLETESERDAFHSNFKSFGQHAEHRMMTKATPAEQKGQTTQENLGMETTAWDPSFLHPSTSHQPLELNEELTGMLDETDQLEITTRQSGPHTQMSQATFETAPPTHDGKQETCHSF